VVNHIKGYHDKAKSHWADAGLDVGAAFIPFVPAGASKVVKGIDIIADGAKTVDKVADAGKVVDKAVPNPHGAKGKPDHRAKIDELKAKATSENPGQNVVIEKKINVEGSNRRPDVQVQDPNTGKTTKVYEAERNPNSQRNLNREDEYRRLGISYETHKVGGN
jgi:hypothetical protein